jgi:FGGY-family pentulose kinase
MLAAAAHEIQIWRPQADFVEQSSEDIWSAACAAVRQALTEARVGPREIRGLGFDATCSLVVLDAENRPVAVSPGGHDEQNVIVWMDHRAALQAKRINAAGHEVLKYVGGRISPEMQTPKLLWLKEELPHSWSRAAHFFDLPDYLTFRATGDETRSLCTTVCKWTYLGHESPGMADSIGRWEDSYFREIGLGELVDEGYRRIGRRVRPIGEPVGSGLSEFAARSLGLRPGTPVSVGIIDAHAGGLGLLGATLDGDGPGTVDFDQRIALIGGTSSCHMAVSAEPRFVPGVWGPYFSAMVPGLWLTEGGQSATGALIDHVILSHARGAELQHEARDSGWTIYELLNNRLERMAAGLPFPALLTRELHVLPYFHGNRSPRADASLRGSIVGLKLSESVESLALLYLATVQAIAQGTRHILEALNAQGYAIRTILACGGGTKNPVFLREHADACGCRIVLPREPEAVLLGTAILGAVAAGEYPDVVTAMGKMSHAGAVVHPAGGAVAEYHARRRAVFGRMYEDFVAYRELMA